MHTITQYQHPELDAIIYTTPVIPTDVALDTQTVTQTYKSQCHHTTPVT